MQASIFILGIEKANLFKYFKIPLGERERDFHEEEFQF